MDINGYPSYNFGENHIWRQQSYPMWTIGAYASDSWGTIGAMVNEGGLHSDRWFLTNKPYGDINGVNVECFLREKGITML